MHYKQLHKYKFAEHISIKVIYFRDLNHLFNELIGKMFSIKICLQCTVIYIYIYKVQLTAFHVSTDDLYLSVYYKTDRFIPLLPSLPTPPFSIPSPTPHL